MGRGHGLWPVSATGSQWPHQAASSARDCWAFFYWLRRMRPGNSIENVGCHYKNPVDCSSYFVHATDLQQYREAELTARGTKRLEEAAQRARAPARARSQSSRIGYKPTILRYSPTWRRPMTQSKLPIAKVGRPPREPARTPSLCVLARACVRGRAPAVVFVFLVCCALARVLFYELRPRKICAAAPQPQINALQTSSTLLVVSCICRCCLGGSFRSRQQ